MEYGVIFIFLLVFIAVIFFTNIRYKDKKLTIDDFNLIKVDTPNNDMYFRITCFKLDFVKFNIAKEIFTQNTIINFDGSKFIVTRLGGIFPLDFYTNELRIIVKSYLIIDTISVQNINVYIGENSTAYLSFDQNQYQQINEVYQTIENNTEIDLNDKKVLLEFLKDISGNKKITKDKTSIVYQILEKYEPIIGIASNLISIIGSILSFWHT